MIQSYLDLVRVNIGETYEIKTKYLDGIYREDPVSKVSFLLVYWGTFIACGQNVIRNVLKLLLSSLRVKK